MSTTISNTGKSPVNVAFCIPFLVIGGVDMVFIRTLQELKQRANVNITILTHENIHGAFFKDWCAQNPDIRIITYYPWQRAIERIAQYTKFFPAKNIRKIIFSLYKKYRRLHVRLHPVLRNIDIFIDYKNGEFWKELRTVKRPKIVWVHGSINYFYEHALYSQMDVYDHMVCLSDSFLNDFCARHPQRAAQISRIYNPIDYTAIAKMAASQDMVDGKYFCVVSRLDPDKDVETIVRAFDIFWCENNRPDAKMVIVGGGICEKSLRKLAASLPSAAQYVFTGASTKPFGYMRGAMAHILSSYNEGLPTVLIEAAALGVLNISSDCKSGPREILMNGGAGLLFTPGDVNELARIMADVWHGRVNRDEMIAAATRGLERFRADVITDQIRELIYKQLKS